MSDSAPSVTPSRSLALAAAGVLLLSVPFFVFGLAFFDTKARITLACESGGPCTLTRAGWLTEEVVGVFPLEELREARVDRSRATRGERQPIFRPVLVTTRGEFPLSYEWMGEEKKASRVTRAINRFRANPTGRGFTMWHDDRPTAGRMGAIFLAVGGVVLLFGAWLAWRARKRRRQERAHA